MFSSAVALARFTYSIGSGAPFSTRSLERVVDGILDNLREFGPVDSDVREALEQPLWEVDEQREIQLTRLRKLALRAQKVTEHYAAALPPPDDLQSLTWDGVADLPLTTKAALRANPDSFIARDVAAVAVSETTGTTGSATRVSFSRDELTVMRCLGLIGFALGARITDSDVLLMLTTPRALATTNLYEIAARIGAYAQVRGVADPRVALAMLQAGVGPSRTQPTVLCVYPSHLAQIVDLAVRSRLRPGAFGLRRILTGSELLSEGLAERARQVFGDVAIDETYALTETFPFGGEVCEAGHLHFEPTMGLLEVLKPFGGHPAGAGERARIVATPLPPFRETTLLLRYDTQDVVETVRDVPRCSMRHVPACSRPLGKLTASVRLDDGGLICPRDLVEPLERLPGLPLPARYAVRSDGDTISVDVVAPDVRDRALRRQVIDALLDGGVPLAELTLVAEPARLSRPHHVRADLREPEFSHSAPDSRAA